MGMAFMTAIKSLFASPLFNQAGEYLPGFAVYFHYTHVSYIAWEGFRLAFVPFLTTGKIIVYCFLFIVYC
jgi:asparagine N-glycosylation enzyme membrane subunit Stt3